MIDDNYSSLQRTYCLAVIGIVAVILYATSPLTGDFWWSDAPRHALNGIFVKDLLTALPLADPAGYATGYYLQYPALTILFYPPLFYAVSAAFFAVAGIGHPQAQMVVAMFYFALGAGCFALARFWLRPLGALAAAVLLMVMPEMALWGRQVMLEVPMLAFTCWAAWLLLRFDREGRFGLFCGALILMIAAVYTKQTAALIVPACAWHLARGRGRSLVTQPRFWAALALAAIALIPLGVLTLKFGAANIQSVVAVADMPAARASLANWLWYGARLPGMTGWLPLLMAALFLVLRGARKDFPVPRRDLEFLAGWFAGGYLLLSVISLKEERHATLLLVPLAIWAAALVDGLSLPLLRRTALAAAVSGCLAFTLAFCPVPRVSGYRQAAQWIGRMAPPHSVIIFSGKRDGSFIYAMRTATGRSDLWTVRADKLLLDVAVRRQLGVREHDLSEAQIRDLIRRLNVRYIVMQQDFWTDLPVMRRFQHVLASASFREMTRIAVEANVPTEDKEIRIYRSLMPPASGDGTVTVGLPIIGRSISGAVGK